MATGSIDAIDWIRGRAERSPCTRRHLPGPPSMVDLAIEYEAGIEARTTAGYQVR